LCNQGGVSENGPNKRGTAVNQWRLLRRAVQSDANKEQGIKRELQAISVQKPPTSRYSPADSTLRKAEAEAPELPEPCRTSFPILHGVHFGFLPVLSKDLSRSDNCSDPWINFPASAIKRTVFLFSSSILRRNSEDSSSDCGEDRSSSCDPGITWMLLSSIKRSSDANYQIAQETDAQDRARRRDV
jgi:hypothetical protein